MPDSQSSEPGFESPFATVSKIGHFRSLHWRPSWLSCTHEYLAIDSGEHVSDLVFAHNCRIARMLPGETELVSEWTGLSGRAKSVKRFERFNRPDIALYKNYLYLYILCKWGVVTVDKHELHCIKKTVQLTFVLLAASSIYNRKIEPPWIALHASDYFVSNKCLQIHRCEKCSANTCSVYNN